MSDSEDIPEIEEIKDELKSFIIKPSDFRLLNPIGKGGYATVYLAQNKKTGDEVAYKQLSTGLRIKQLINFSREVSTMARVHHPFLLKLYGFSPNKPLTIVTEYIPNGSLFEFMQSESKRKRLTNTRRTLIAMGIAHAMAQLHKLGIIHRDIKSLNIFLDGDLLPRLGDFGIARYVTDDEPMTMRLGTPHWMAPESLKDANSYGPEVDVYSFAMLLYELLTNSIPWQGMDPMTVITNVVINKERPEIPEDTAEPLRDLIERCWAQNPKKRPTFAEIYKLFATGKVEFEDTEVDAIVWLTGELEKYEKEKRTKSAKETKKKTKQQDKKSRKKKYDSDSSKSSAKGSSDDDFQSPKKKKTIKETKKKKKSFSSDDDESPAKKGKKKEISSDNEPSYKKRKTISSDSEKSYKKRKNISSDNESISKKRIKKGISSDSEPSYKDRKKQRSSDYDDFSSDGSVRGHSTPPKSKKKTVAATPNIKRRDGKDIKIPRNSDPIKKKNRNSDLSDDTSPKRRKQLTKNTSESDSSQKKKPNKQTKRIVISSSDSEQDAKISKRKNRKPSRRSSSSDDYEFEEKKRKGKSKKYKITNPKSLDLNDSESLSDDDKRYRKSSRQLKVPSIRRDPNSYQKADINQSDTSSNWMLNDEEYDKDDRRNRRDTFEQRKQIPSPLIKPKDRFRKSMMPNERNFFSEPNKIKKLFDPVISSRSTMQQKKDALHKVTNLLYDKQNAREFVSNDFHLMLPFVIPDQLSPKKAEKFDNNLNDECFDLLFVLFKTVPQLLQNDFENEMTKLINISPPKSIVLLSNFSSKFSILKNPYPLLDVMISQSSVFLKTSSGALLISTLYELCTTYEDFRSGRLVDCVLIFLAGIQSTYVKTIRASYNALCHFYNGDDEVDFDAISYHLEDDRVNDNALNFLLRLDHIPVHDELISSLLTISRKNEKGVLCLIKMTTNEERAFSIFNNDPKRSWISMPLPTVEKTLQLFLALVKYPSISQELLSTFIKSAKKGNVVSNTLKRISDLYLLALDENNSILLRALAATLQALAHCNGQNQNSIPIDFLAFLKSSKALKIFFEQARDIDDEFARKAALVFLMILGEIDFQPEYMIYFDKLRLLLKENAEYTDDAIEVVSLLSQYPLCAQRFKELNLKNFFLDLLNDDKYKTHADNFLFNIDKYTKYY